MSSMTKIMYSSKILYVIVLSFEMQLISIYSNKMYQARISSMTKIMYSSKILYVIVLSFEMNISICVQACQQIYSVLFLRMNVNGSRTTTPGTTTPRTTTLGTITLGATSL